MDETANIFLLGRDKKSPDMSYDWDGLKRQDIGTYVFQYTLSGTGNLEIDGKCYSLKAGEAFLVEIPSEHRYYLPKDSDGWEFIFITLVGRKAMECWRYILENNGPVLKISPESKLIQLLFGIYQDTIENKITDSYLASASAYEYIMECYRFVRDMENHKKDLSDQITKTLSYMQSHYAEPLTLSDIAAVSGYSKYYLVKHFQEQLDTTPIKYLTKIRVQKAVDLLMTTRLSITEIADRVGYSNANYFNKVFRKAVGMAAGEFRKRKNPAKIDHLITD